MSYTINLYGNFLFFPQHMGDKIESYQLQLPRRSEYGAQLGKFGMLVKRDEKGLLYGELHDGGNAE